KATPGRAANQRRRATRQRRGVAGLSPPPANRGGIESAWVGVLQSLGPDRARLPSERGGAGLRRVLLPRSALVIGVLALHRGVAEHLRMLAEAGARPVSVRRTDELSAVDGLVIPGGESTTMWKLAVAFDLAEPLRKRISGGMAAFGSCAGMIMLADQIVDGAAGQATIGGIGMAPPRNALGAPGACF